MQTDNADNQSVDISPKALSDVDFIDLVWREIWKRATSQEINYLWSSPEIIDRWHAELGSIQRRIESKVQFMKSDLLSSQQVFISTQGKEAKAAWFAYKAEQDTKIAQQTRILTLVKERNARINTWRKQRPPQQTSDSEYLERDFVRTYRAGYCDGWMEATNHFRKLSQEGHPALTIFRVFRLFWKVNLKPWKSDENLLAKPPRLPDIGPGILKAIQEMKLHDVLGKDDENMF